MRAAPLYIERVCTARSFSVQKNASDNNVLTHRDDRVAFDVASAITRELARDRSLRRIQPAHERAVGNLRRKSGQELGIGAAPCHLPRNSTSAGATGTPAKLECHYEDQRSGIEAFGSEQRAARRASDPYNPLDRILRCAAISRRAFNASHAAPDTGFP